MPMHRSTMHYHEPTEHQKVVMGVVRNAGTDYVNILEKWVPDGPDKTYLLRHLREVAMWANVTITRLPDGTPRPDQKGD